MAHVESGIEGLAAVCNGPECDPKVTMMKSHNDKILLVEEEE